MTGTGDFTILYQFNTRPNGKNTFRYFINAKATAYAEDGSKYEVKYNDQIEEAWTEHELGVCPASFKDKFRLASKTAGGKNNLTIVGRFEISLDCEGNVDIKFDEFEVECQ